MQLWPRLQRHQRRLRWRLKTRRQTRQQSWREPHDEIQVAVPTSPHFIPQGTPPTSAGLAVRFCDRNAKDGRDLSEGGKRGVILRLMSAVVFANYSSFAVIQPAFWCVCVCVFKVKIYLRCTEGTAGRKAAAEPTNGTFCSTLPGSTWRRHEEI